MAETDQNNPVIPEGRPFGEDKDEKDRASVL